MSQINSLAAETEQRRYYCRGCGQPLVAGVRSHFHRECLKSDKKERVRKQRRLEQMRFEAWLQRRQCPKCGERYGDGDEPMLQLAPLREASQQAKDRNSLGD